MRSKKLLNIHVHFACEKSGLKDKYEIKEKFKCRKCEKRFFTPYERKAHEKVHSMVKCQYCDKHMASRATLNIHINFACEKSGRKEMNDVTEKYQCKKCSRKFFTKINYLTHTRTCTSDESTP